MHNRDTMDIHGHRATVSESMQSVDRQCRMFCTVARGRVFRWMALGAALSIVPAAGGQISLPSAVDLALHGNPRVLGAQDDVKKAHAQVSEAHDVYVPSIAAGANLGQSYGYSPYPPTLFTVNSGFLVYNPGQFSYMRSAEAGLNAAQLALADVREQVAEDTALAFVALQHDQQRAQAVCQQSGYADKLVSILQQRVDAGQDTPLDLTQAKLTQAQLRLAAMREEDNVASDKDRLALLIGVPFASLSIDNSFPAQQDALTASSSSSVHGYASPAVAAAFASAEAKRMQAMGDARFHFWPQINFFGQYNRYATFSESFAQTQKLYQFGSGSNTSLSADAGAFGIQITIPLLDKTRSAKARESAADAAHAFHDAQNAQIEAQDGQFRARHNISELELQGEVASLEQQLAQQKLDVLRVQLQAGSGDPSAQPMTPKDEQKARIDEREKYLAVVDAEFQLRQARIQLLRQTGELEAWLKTAATAQPPVGGAIQNGLPATPQPQP